MSLLFYYLKKSIFTHDQSIIKIIISITYKKEKKEKCMSTNNKDNCPIELIGNWKDDRDEKCKISNYCSYFIVGTSPYNIDGNDILHYGRDTTYQRTSGDPGSLIGIWVNEEFAEQITFNEDGTYTNTWLDDGTVYTGTFVYTDTDITTTELRATLQISGSNIIWIKTDDGTTFFGTFEIISNDQWILRLENMDEVTYTRI